MVDTKKLIHEFKLLLDPELGRLNGRFLYSEVTTIRKGEFYLLGTNPGGSEEEGLLLLEDLKNLETNFNSY